MNTTALPLALAALPLEVIFKPCIKDDEHITQIFGDGEHLGNFRVSSSDQATQWSFNGVLLDTTVFAVALLKVMKGLGYAIVTSGDGKEVDFFRVEDN